MGMTVTLESEDGTPEASIEDPTNILHRVLPSPGDAAFQWANTIDWYGDTTFNRLQAPLLREEWKILVARANDAAAAALLREVDQLLDRCANGTHLYVKFYGD
jgi:hypothetical protein